MINIIGKEFIFTEVYNTNNFFIQYNICSCIGCEFKCAGNCECMKTKTIPMKSNSCECNGCETGCTGNCECKNINNMEKKNDI